MNQRQTKDEPKNSQTQKVLFIKIAVSFTSLIPCLVLPRELRETTDGPPKEDLMSKKALFLRLSPKKVDLIPEKVVSLPKKVDSIPKKVDSIPEIVDLHFSPLHPTTEKSTKNHSFFAHLEKKVYLCSQNTLSE